MQIPAYAAIPKSWAASVSVGSALRDGTGTTTLVTLAAGARGAKIEKIYAKARATTTLGMLRFYLHDGVNFFIWKEIVVTALVPSGTVTSWEGGIDCSGPDTVLQIPSGWTVRVVPANSEAFDISAVGGEF